MNPGSSFRRTLIHPVASHRTGGISQLHRELHPLSVGVFQLSSSKQNRVKGQKVTHGDAPGRSGSVCPSQRAASRSLHLKRVTIRPHPWLVLIGWAAMSWRLDHLRDYGPRPLTVASVVTRASESSGLSRPNSLRAEHLVPVCQCILALLPVQACSHFTADSRPGPDLVPVWSHSGLVLVLTWNQSWSCSRPTVHSTTPATNDRPFGPRDEFAGQWITSKPFINRPLPRSERMASRHAMTTAPWQIIRANIKMN